MKCSICKQTIQTTFLDKIAGTYVKKDGNQHPVCDECQRAYSIDEIIEQL